MLFPILLLDIVFSQNSFANQVSMCRRSPFSHLWGPTRFWASDPLCRCCCWCGVVVLPFWCYLCDGQRRPGPIAWPTDYPTTRSPHAGPRRSAAARHVHRRRPRRGVLPPRRRVGMFLCVCPWSSRPFLWLVGAGPTNQDMAGVIRTPSLLASPSQDCCQRTQQPPNNTRKCGR